MLVLLNIMIVYLILFLASFKSILAQDVLQEALTLMKADREVFKLSKTNENGRKWCQSSREYNAIKAEKEKREFEEAVADFAEKKAFL